MGASQVIEIPPSSIADLEAALKDTTQFVYLVVSGSGDSAWKLAVSLSHDLAGVLPVRIENRADASRWITKDGAIAVTFDSEGKVKGQLAKADAENRKTVSTALADAMDN